VPLGFAGEVGRRNASIDFQVGARITLYTDGLVERRKESLDVGLERLATAALQARREPLDRFQDHVLRVLFADYEQRDDVAMICAELVSQSEHRFVRCLDADPTELKMTRHSLAHWLAAGGAEPFEQHDIVLAVNEALANAVEHGRGGPASIDLELARSDDQLMVTVRDRGHGHPRVPQPTRGRGLPIMRAIADRVDIEPAQTGTRVSLSIPIGRGR
jgi:anti-sigma regulatory factor (Ser/Thr protein kinase)